MKECPRNINIADLDWPESKRKEGQTICHVQIGQRIPVVICDNITEGMTVIIILVKIHLIFCNNVNRRRAVFASYSTDQA